MGNCIGKKARTQNKRYKHSPSIISRTKLHCNNQLDTPQTLSTSSSSEKTNVLPLQLSDIKESDILFNNEEEIEIKPIEYPSSSSLITTINDQFLLTHTSPTLSPSQCKRFKSNNTTIDSRENTQINEQNTIIEHLFSKEKEINTDQEITSELFDISSSPSLSDSSLSSISCITTLFSSQDHLILSSSSSPSSLSSTNINPILPSYQLSNHYKFHSFLSSEQIYFNKQFSNEIFSTILPLSSSRYINNLFLNKFHQNTITHNCQTLRSIIDNVLQQQVIRIHQQTKTILIEHKQLQCIHLKDFETCQKPSLIFDEDHKRVYITKYAHFNELQTIASVIKDIPRNFSSCNHCSLILSPSKFNNYLQRFFLVNITYNLVQICFNNINNHNKFGYISKIYSNKIQQTIINNSKLTYSYDLDIEHTKFYFVLHIQSWPNEIRTIYEQRKRLWPLNTNHLFDNTCFIRFNDNQQEISTIDKCHTCGNILSLCSNSSWSYTYAAIEDKLVLNMSDGHKRFASIVWNYLNGKTQGQISFNIFKHTLFYFFEKYTSDSFTTSDLYSHIQIFIEFFFNHLKTKFIPHYFNINYNLYNDNISTILISIKMIYFDLKNFSFYLLPDSSLYLNHCMYLIQFQSNFLQYLHSSKTNLIQTIFDTHELVIKQLSLGIKTYKQQLDSTIAIKSHRSLTLDCLYRYQEENVQLILDYLPLLREKEPSLFIHSIWSIFIQYLNSLFDNLFIS